MASQATQAQYLRDGHRLLVRARALYPKSSELQALVGEASHEDVLMAATIRRYRPAYLAALHVLVEAGKCDEPQAEEAYAAISEKLRNRAGRPNPLRTAALKIVATKAQAEATFLDLKAKALNTRNSVAIAAALYVLVVPRIGIRPVELIGARIVGTTLVVRNAKRRPRQKPERRISLKRFPVTFLEATQWLIILANAGATAYEDQEQGFELWRNKLASCLARSSENACGARLSLYSFRHLGIATWKAAGFSAETIAGLAGHLLPTSAGRYYAPAAAGWTDEAVLAEVEEAPVAPAPVTKNTAREVDPPECPQLPTPPWRSFVAKPAKAAKANYSSWDAPKPEPLKVAGAQPGSDVLFADYRMKMEEDIRLSEERAARARAAGGIRSDHSASEPNTKS